MMNMIGEHITLFRFEKIIVTLTRYYLLFQI